MSKKIKIKYNNTDVTSVNYGEQITLHTAEKKLLDDLTIESDSCTSESLTVTPNTSIQEIVPESADFLDSVIVNPIPDDYAKVSGTITLTTNGVFDVKTKEQCIVSFNQYWGDYAEIEEEN